MRFGIFAVLVTVSAPALADEMLLYALPVERRVIAADVESVPRRASVRRVVCVKCRSAGLPWGGLRPVRKATLPWGGLPDYCPPAVSRTVVVVTKG